MPDPTWRIETKRQVKSVLRRLPKPLCKRIEQAIDALAHDPLPPGSRKLTGYDYYRIRVGDWRIVYSVDNDILVVVIVEVSSRGGAYRNL